MQLPEDLTRRDFVGATTAAVTFSLSATDAMAADLSSASLPCSLTINGRKFDLDLEARVTLLDLLREKLHLTGTKKGCDHGQCGACTVLVSGTRIKSCLTLACMQDGNTIITIEGLAVENQLHPMQAAFIAKDGFQCGFCTSGQICSAVAMLEEWRATAKAGAQLTDAEIRERMAGNLCRCGAYPNIVAAIREVHEKQVHAG